MCVSCRGYSVTRGGTSFLIPQSSTNPSWLQEDNRTPPPTDDSERPSEQSPVPRATEDASVALHRYSSGAPLRPTPMKKVANRNAKVWHGATENGP